MRVSVGVLSRLRRRAPRGAAQVRCADAEHGAIRSLRAALLRHCLRPLLLCLTTHGVGGGDECAEGQALEQVHFVARTGLAKAPPAQMRHEQSAVHSTHHDVFSRHSRGALSRVAAYESASQPASRLLEWGQLRHAAPTGSRTLPCEASTRA